MRPLLLSTALCMSLLSSAAIACGMPPKAGLSLADALERVEAAEEAVVPVVVAAAVVTPAVVADAPEQAAPEAPKAEHTPAYTPAQTPNS